MDWVCAIDRIEGSGRDAIAIVVGDDERVLEVPVHTLGTLAVEGAVLRVPLVGDTPDWAAVRRDRGEESRRRKALANRVRKLRDRDPGGDIEL